MKLKGKNQIVEFKQFADKLVSTISSHEGVSGIIFLGGLARGFVDQFSDLDITILLNTKDETTKKQIHDICSNEQKVSGVEIDLQIFSLDDFKKRGWNEVDRWEYSKAQIAFDPNGNVERSLIRLNVPEDTWKRRIAACAEYLKWYCCPPEENIDSIAYTWVKRGDLVAAHYCLNYSVELFLKLVFALNREFLPPPKWRIFYSHQLKWLPKGYREFVKEVMGIKDFSKDCLKQRLEAMQKMWTKTVPRIEEQTGLNLEEIHRYYVERILSQTMSRPPLRQSVKTA